MVLTLGVFEIGIWELCLLGVLLLAFVYEVYFYARYMWVRHEKVTGDGLQVTDGEKPGVSVVVCARNEGYNLKPYIQSLLTQDYPLYEVIIVNDGSEDNTQAVIDEYAALDKRVKTTFVPIGARVRSTKKLGLTLAAKAAQYDYLLLTDADCRPESIHWISSMMEGFGCGEGAKDEKIEVVLGYGAYFWENSMLNEIIQYDTLFNGVHYLGAAATGKPYMGVGRNLAYRKETFFAHGGFSELMTEGAGDDDLFVNKVATKRNTAVVCTPESITWSVPKHTWKSWLQQKRRHLSVSGAYNARSKGHLMREPFARGMFYLLFIVLMIFGSPLVMSAAFVLFLLRMLLQVSMLDVSARRLGQPQLGIEVVWFDMLLPVVTGVMLLLPKRKEVW